MPWKNKHKMLDPYHFSRGFATSNCILNQLISFRLYVVPFRFYVVPFRNILSNLHWRKVLLFTEG